MSERTVTHPEYETLFAQGQEALAAGSLPLARERFGAAWSWARQRGDLELEDRAFCNQAAVAISLGEVDDPVPELRRILMANRSLETCFLAAYNIARAYELRKEAKKGLFYARIARDRAVSLERSDWVSYGKHQIANFLVAESYFGEARGEYLEALSLMPDDRDGERLIAEINLGYCELMLERHQRGLRRLYAAVRRARRAGMRRAEAIARVDLCYGMLEAGRLEKARQHGQRGLSLAEECEETDVIKNALFLLGQVERAAGRSDEARRHHENLQSRFYPDQPSLPDILSFVDVGALVNLRA